jgi:hypothetical protein
MSDIANKEAPLLYLAAITVLYWEELLTSTVQQPDNSELWKKTRRRITHALHFSNHRTEA